MSQGASQWHKISSWAKNNEVLPIKTGFWEHWETGLAWPWFKANMCIGLSKYIKWPAAKQPHVVVSSSQNWVDWRSRCSPPSSCSSSSPPSPSSSPPPPSSSTPATQTWTLPLEEQLWEGWVDFFLVRIHRMTKNPHRIHFFSQEESLGVEGEVVEVEGQDWGETLSLDKLFAFAYLRKYSSENEWKYFVFSFASSSWSHHVPTHVLRDPCLLHQELGCTLCISCTYWFAWYV